MLTAQATADMDAGITPFWQRIPKFFLYPFHVTPLLYCALLAGASLVAIVLPTFLVELCIAVPTLRYAFKVMEQTSLGYLTPDQHEMEDKPERANLPYKLVGMLLAWGFFVGLFAGINPFFGAVANFFVTFALPASVMALAASNSIGQGLNPAKCIEIMRAVGKPYFALWVFLYLLMSGAFVLLPLIAPLFKGWLLLPVVNFVFIYFTLVMFNMMGYCLYQYHNSLGLDVKVDFDAATDGSEPAAGAKPRDLVGEAIAEKVGAGDIKGALEAAYDQQRTATDDVNVQERYHKLLVLDGDQDRILNHGRHLITLLLRKDRGDRAFQVFKACRELRAEFAIEDPGMLFKLSQAARRARDFNLALELVRGFDKRNPRHPDVPAVYLSSAQILSEHYKKDDMATLILNGLIQKFPDHPLRAEADSYLKVIDRMAALRVAPKA